MGKNPPVAATVFVLLAIGFGSWFTDTYLIFWRETHFIVPLVSSTVIGLFIIGALSCRGYFLRPQKTTPSVLLFLANWYMFSLLAYHMLGEGLEKVITIGVLLGLTVLLWLGLKQFIGLYVLGIFAILIYKVVMIDLHLDWRAFPFIACGFLGVYYQSDKIFADLEGLSSAFFCHSKSNAKTEVAQQDGVAKQETRAS